MSQTQTPAVGNLKERIAALQQRSVSPQQQGQQSGSGSGNGNVGSLRSKIAKFESKGGTPIPRGSFGLGAPPEGKSNTSRELYGNRIPSIDKQSGPTSRSESPLPSTDNSPSPSGFRRRASDTVPDIPGPLDLTGVSKRLAFQRNMDILNGSPSSSEPSVSPTTDRAQSPSSVVSNDNDALSPRRNSLAILGAGRRSASSSDGQNRALTSPLRTTHVSDDEMTESRSPVTPSIVISPEPSSASLTEDLQLVEEPIQLTLTPEPEPTIVESPEPKEAAVPTPPANGTKDATEPNPYEEFTSQQPSPVIPILQAPVPQKSTPASILGSRPETDVATAPSALKPKRTSSLVPIARPTRSPSPTPSMVHESDPATVEAIPAARSRRSRSNSNGEALSNAHRTIVGLPPNPPPAPDNEDRDMSYGSITLVSRSETNLLDPVKKTKSGFTAVVHRKVTASAQAFPPPVPAKTASPPPIHTRRTPGETHTIVPESPGFGDLAALMEEAALLEERLKRNEAAAEGSWEDKLTGSDGNGFQLQPFSVSSGSVPSIGRAATPENYDEESLDSVPPPPPPKGIGRVMSGIKKLTASNSLRSKNSLHSRLSTSGSEVSSEDTASMGTRSDIGLGFPNSPSSGSLDRQSIGGKSALSFGGSPSSKKNGTSRSSSFAGKMWQRSRTKSNVSTENGELHSTSKKQPHTVSGSSPSRGCRQDKDAPALPQAPLKPIAVTAAIQDARNRPSSWLSQNSTASSASYNTTSTVSPNSALFDEAFFNAFPSVPQDLPQIQFPGSPTSPEGTNFNSRTSMDPQTVMNRSETLPARSKGHSAQKLT